MPLTPFREIYDPDEKRKEILWLALSFIIILATWLAVVMLFGYRPLAVGLTYDEAVMGMGLAVLILCAISYLAVREREQRHTNRHLLAQLGTTVADLDERLRHLNGLCATSAQLIGSVDTRHISRLVADAVAGIMNASVHLVLVDGRSGLPVHAVTSPHGDPEDHRGIAAPPHTWPAPLLAADGRIGDLQAQVAAWNQLGYLIAAPVRVGKALNGVLIAQTARDAPHFTSDHLNTLTTIANMASKAFESSEFYGELRDSYLATVRSLVYSLDARDNYAAAHGHRVAGLAGRIAERMGLSEEMVRDLEAFAPLHDVGKIGVPDSILLKTGPLTQEERELCKAHCLIGERIIRPLKPGRTALSLVRSHHECWDGSGYPDGLRAEQIPLLARIIQVADCYDALISDRPYRATLSVEEVLAHFRTGSGTRYDPAVVSCLYELVRDEQTPPRSSPSAPSEEPSAAVQAGVLAAR